MELGKLSELSLILVSMYHMSVDDISTQTMGFNPVAENQFITIVMSQGVTIILPDITASRHCIYRETDTNDGLCNMIYDLSNKGFCSVEISKFLDIPVRRIEKILKRRKI